MKPGTRSLAFNWFLLIFWSWIIFFLSDQPEFGQVLPGFLGSLISYSFHFVEYAVLAFLAVRVFSTISRFSRQRILISAILFSIIYAVLDEYHQSYVPGREASLFDLSVDVLGILAIVYLKESLLISRLINPKSKAQMPN